MPEPAEPDALIPFRLASQIQARKSIQHAADRDTCLEPSDVHSGTGVIGLPERDVTVRLARDIETFGIRELSRIAIRCTHSERDEGTWREGVATDVGFRGGDAVVELKGALETQQFLYRTRDDFWIRAQL